jgi:hypothetical protein
MSAATATRLKLTAVPATPEPIRLREEWLNQLAAAFMAHMTDTQGLAFPPVRVTCGFPSRGGEMGGKTRVRGQCWSAEASEDAHAEIFISPVEADAETVAAILAHELVHAALPDAGHGKPFQVVMKKVGHVAPFTSAIPVDAFWEWVRPLLATVGPYPHAMLVAMRAVAAPKKQVARMLKAECAASGYTVRLARKWIVDVGPPVCPCHGIPMMVEGLEDDGDQEDGGDE